MSKFLKFIVHFVVICTILCVVALAVPPFFGVTTEIRDDSTVKSNLAMGSVTYAIPVKTEEAALGTPILVNDENAVYRYTLASADVANGTGTAMDPTVSQGQPINVAIGSYLPKIVVTISALMALAVILCLATSAFSKQLQAVYGNNAVTMEYETELFDTDQVMDIDILMDEDDWNDMLENAISEEYYSCDVVVNGKKFYSVGIRPKGNTSLSSIASAPDTDRYSFKLEFDWVDLEIILSEKKDRIWVCIGIITAKMGILQ